MTPASRLDPSLHEELKCVARFLWAKNTSPEDIHQQLRQVYGKRAGRNRDVEEMCRELVSGKINWLSDNDADLDRNGGQPLNPWNENKPTRFQMGHVIITALSLVWVLLTIVSTLAVFSAILTPKWLMGPFPLEVENGTIVPSVGIFNRCTRIKGQNNCAVFAMDGLATDSVVFPPLWKLSLVLFTLGLVVMVLSTMAAIISCCVQSINRKSIFTITGTVQATAGLFYILGLVLYAAGWGSPRVIKLCGRDAGPFTVGDCTFGWAMYAGLVGTCLTFLTACLSVCAEKTTSSDKVSRKVERGQTLVCLL